MHASRESSATTPEAASQCVPTIAESCAKATNHKPSQLKASMAAKATTSSSPRNRDQVNAGHKNRTAANTTPQFTIRKRPRNPATFMTAQTKAHSQILFQAEASNPAAKAKQNELKFTRPDITPS